VRTVKTETALAGLLADWLADWLDTAMNPAAATRVHRACMPGRAIALPTNRYFYTNSDNRLHNFVVPSNTVEITDGFSNARAVGFTLLRKTLLVRLSPSKKFSRLAF